MTMNASTPAAPSVPSTPSAASGAGGVSARVAALKASLEASEGPTTSEPATESSATPSPSPGEASSMADSGAAGAPPRPLDQAARDRMERIQRVRAREEADRRETEQRKARQGNDGEIEKMRKRLAELEPLEGVFSSEESLLAEAEKRKMSPEKLVQWMRTKISDPGAIAKREAQTEAEKLRAEIKAERDAREKLENDLKTQREQAETERAQEAKTTTFLSDARSKVDSHPRTARALERWKDEGLIAFVNHTVAPHLPERYDPSHLHDLLEDYFEKTEAFGGPAPNTEVAPANGQRPTTTKNGAGQPATTISNALTSGRGSLVEEVPLHKLPLEDRKARLKAKLERE